MNAAKKDAKKQMKRLSITLTKSPIGYPSRQKGTVRALGLRRLHQTVKHEDTPIIRGMIAKIQHLVAVDEVG
jgi:large subunit ribosomal protein L30